MNGFFKSLKVSAVLLGSVCLFAPSSTFASELDLNAEAAPTQVAPQDIVPNIPPIRGGNEITPREPIISYYYTKKNVSTYYIWGPAQRVSDNMVAGKSGATISSDKGITYNVELNGDIGGLGYSLGTGFTSSVGYQGNIDPNRTGYMSHKAYYKVETGTRQKISDLGNVVVAENYYTIRTPLYGQFQIVYVN